MEVKAALNNLRNNGIEIWYLFLQHFYLLVSCTKIIHLNQNSNVYFMSKLVIAAVVLFSLFVYFGDNYGSYRPFNAMSENYS